MTRWGRIVWASSESRQSVSRSPPSRSRTMTSTSLMVHPAEVRGPGYAAKRHSPLVGNGHRNRAVFASASWQIVRPPLHLDHRIDWRRVLQHEPPFTQEKRQRVTGVHDP